MNDGFAIRIQGIRGLAKARPLLKEKHEGLAQALRACYMRHTTT